jgi:hypothetical protein
MLHHGLSGMMLPCAATLAIWKLTALHAAHAP